MSSLNISKNALNLSIESPLTNEIPHLSIYDILNKNLRCTWSREFIGKTTVSYGQDFTSQKIMNSEFSENYKPREYVFTDPDDDSIYSVDIEKINFTVDGAIETEIDYLMHEMSRYLLKLYPDDFNALTTLTEAERQSYFNEALHMIHSYFDTTQIIDSTASSESDKLKNEFYYKNNFITGLNPIRSLTGSAHQEESLIKLLTTDTDSEVFSGYCVFTDGTNTCVTNNSENNIVEDFTEYTNNYYLTDTQYLAQLVKDIHGKIISDDLSYLLSNNQQLINLNTGSINSSFNIFDVLDSSSINDFLAALINGTGDLLTTDDDLNECFYQATVSNCIGSTSNLINIQSSDFDKSFGFKNLGSIFTLLSGEAVSNELVLMDSKTNQSINPIDYENKLLLSTGLKISNMADATLAKLGNVNYNSTFLKAIGNIVYSKLTTKYNEDENFRTNVTNLLQVTDYHLFATIKQGEKILFEGEINKSFLATQNLYDEVNNYTALNFKTIYDANYVFESFGFYKNLEKLQYSTTDKLNIEFLFLNLSDEYTDNDSYIIQDTICNKGCSVKIYKQTDENDKDYYAVTALIVKSGTNDSNYTYYELTGKVTSTESSLKCSSDNTVSGKMSFDGTTVNVQFTVPQENAETLTEKKSYTFSDSNLQFTDVDQNIKGYMISKIVSTEDTTKKYINTAQVKSLVNYTFSTSVIGIIVVQNNETITTGEFDLSSSVLYDSVSSINTVYIELAYMINLNDLLNSCVNTQLSIKTDVENNSYLYYTQLILSSNINLPSTLINLETIAQSLFKAQTGNVYKLFTVDAVGYAKNKLKLETDISEYLQQFGRLNCLIIKGSSLYATRITQTEIKNEYCYATLSDDFDILEDSDNNQCKLVIDLHENVDSSQNTSSKSTRSTSSKLVYSYDDNKKYFIELKWAKLLKENLNQAFSNIYSNNADVIYAADSTLSQATIVPTQLVQQETLSIVSNNSISVPVINDLLTDNKSLYLDSTLKKLIHVPLEVKMLVSETSDKTVSYLSSDDFPSYITYYKLSNLSAYKNLEDFINVTDSSEKTLADLTKTVSRRKMIWGSIVWDANDTNRTIDVLRSIWSSYFANFEVFETDDVIPDENILRNLENTDNKSRTVNLMNFNFAENNGVPTLNWIVNNYLQDNQTTTELVKVLDIFNYNTSVDDMVEFDIEAGGFASCSGYSLKFNRLFADNVKCLQEATYPVYIAGVSIDKAIDIKLKSDVEVSYDYNKASFVFKQNNTEINLLDIYSRPFISTENFESVGLLNAYCNNNTALEIFLEACLTNYYNQTYKITESNKNTENCYNTIYENVVAQNLSVSENVIKSLVSMYAYNELETSTEDTAELVQNRKIKMSDVLDKVLENLSGLNTLPCITVIQDSNLVIYYFNIEKNTNSYTINIGKISDIINNDLLYATLPVIAKTFQIQKSLRDTYVEHLTENQAYLPATTVGTFDNMYIKTNYTVKVNSDETASVYTGEEPNLIELTDNSADTFYQEYLKDSYNNCIKFKSIIENDFMDLSNLQTENITLTLNSDIYQLQSNEKYFKEYTNAYVELFTTDADTENADLQKCCIKFDQDLDLSNCKYLYLKDIYTPDRRTSYTSARETKIIDRSYSLSNLHIIGYNLGTNGFELILKDDPQNYTNNVQEAISVIKPTDETLNTQQTVDTSLNLGYNWVDPHVEIGYTFYKRKCIFGGVISSDDSTIVTLTDENLLNVPDDDSDEENFSLTDHISTGDAVQIILSDSSAYYQDSKTVTFSLPNNDKYIGPYKVIYTMNSTNSNGESVSISILSGAGNLVIATIPLNGGEALTVQGPYIFDDTSKYFAIALGDSNLYYRNDSGLVLIGSIPDFLDNPNSVMKTFQTSEKAISFYDSTMMVAEGGKTEEDGKITITLDISSRVKDETLNSKHSDWYIADVIDTNSSGVNEATPNVLSSVPLNQGYVVEDDLDRLYYEPGTGDSEYTRWLAYPDKAEEFEYIEDSSRPNAFKVTDEEAGTEEIINIEDASTEELQTFIKDRLLDILAADEDGNVDLTINESLSVMDIQIVRTARLISRLNAGNWNINTGNIYIPTLATADIPVLLANGKDPKYQKITYISGSGSTKLTEASDEDLQNFAKVLLPKHLVTRTNPNVTSYAKTKKNFVTWDQDTATLNIMDKKGNLKKRLAIPQVAFEHPVINDNFTYSGAPRSYSLSNLLYAKRTTTDLYFYLKSLDSVSGTCIQVDGKSYNIYSYLGLVLTEAGESGVDETAPGCLYKLLSSATSTDSNIQAILTKIKNKDSYKELLLKCLRYDYMLANICSYPSFMDPTNELYLNNFQDITAAATVISNVGGILANLNINKLIKGLPTAAATETVSTIAGIATVSENDIVNFESLVKTSSIEVSDNYVHIYGVINWPKIGTSNDRANSIYEKLRNTLSLDSPNLTDDEITELIESYEVQLRQKYQFFNDNEDLQAYPTAGTEAPFKVTVSLEDYSVTTAQLSLKLRDASNTECNILSMTATEEGLNVVTTAGSFTLADEATTYIAPDQEEVTKFSGVSNNEGTGYVDSIALVYDALKVTGLFNGISVDDSGEVTVTTVGTALQSPESYYTTVAYVTDKTLKLQNDILNLESGNQAYVTVLVNSATKDNFQGIYGDIDNKSNLSPEQTVFEVNRSTYADFAAYENKDSSSSYDETSGTYTKDTVFDIYPTPEKVSDSQLSLFYKLDDDGEVKYLTNSLGRNILRISNPETINGGKLIKRIDYSKFVTSTYKPATANTVANEWVDEQFLRKAEEDNKSDQVYINDLMDLEKDYEKLTTTLTLQKIPALVSNARDAIISYPYKLTEHELLGNGILEFDGDKNYIKLQISLENFPVLRKELLTENETTDSQKNKNSVLLEDLELSKATVVPINVCVSSIELKIINKTETLPKLIDITKYSSKVVDGNLQIDTDCNELYIPNKGYGQALLSDYTLPTNCKFKEGIFYDSTGKTVNSSNETFILVDSDGNKILDGENDVEIPRMVYKSFAQADNALAVDLATDVNTELNDTFIDLSLFTKASDKILTSESKDTLESLTFKDISNSSLSSTTSEEGLYLENYNLFTTGTKLVCKVFTDTTDYSTSTSDYEEITDSDVLNKIGYTRKYNNDIVPSNLKYLDENSEYQTTSTGILRDLDTLSVTSSGEIYYLNTSGELTTTKTVNTTPVCGTRTKNVFKIFAVDNSKVTAYNINTFRYSKYGLSIDYDKSLISFSLTTDLSKGNILAVVNPNDTSVSKQNFNNLLKLDSEGNEEWPTSIFIEFMQKDPTNLYVNLQITSTDKIDYNIAYLKNKNRETIGKVYFKDSISSDDVIIYQSDIFLKN